MKFYTRLLVIKTSLLKLFIFSSEHEKEFLEQKFTHQIYSSIFIPCVYNIFRDSSHSKHNLNLILTINFIKFFLAVAQFYYYYYYLFL